MTNMIQFIYFFIGMILVFGWFMIIKIWRREAKNEIFHNHLWWFIMFTLTIIWIIFLPSMIFNII